MLLWFVLIRFSVKEAWLKAISLPVLKAEMSYGLVAWSAALFAFLHFRVDQIMIKQYLGSADLGVYTIAVTIAELLFLLPLSINTALT
ncbi:MAG: oligosaccharide flippase family protein, partial [Candidatus Cloacimonetes bacterium]|nr:oligosaccharide flippase family protein [Candidatus Cloacimonadota bacterium]